MPSTSPKQARLMQAAAHDPAFAKKAKVPQKVAKDFVAADKAKGSSPAKSPMGGKSPSDPMGGGSKKATTRGFVTKP